MAVMDAEQHPGYPAAGKVAANLPKPFPARDRPAGRHAHRPAEFDRLDVAADNLAILGGQAEQPIPYRHRSRFGFEESRGQALMVTVWHP